jgi:hypothetical protein
MASAVVDWMGWRVWLQPDMQTRDPRKRHGDNVDSSRAIRRDVLRVRQSDKATIGIAHAWLPVACFHGGAPLHTVHLQWHTVATGNSFYTAAAAPRKHLLNVSNVNSSSSSSKKATVAWPQHAYQLPIV